MRYGIFYYLAGFSKKAVFYDKIAKNRFWGQVSFEGKGVSGDEMNITFFMGNEFSNIFPFNNF